MRRTFFILAVLLIARTDTSHAQDVEVQAVVNETTIGDEETLTYSIEVKGASPSDVEVPNAPATRGLTLLQRTPSEHRNMTIINGRLERSVAYRWAYRPVQTGRARIDAAEVVVGGETYRTQPVTITVVDQSQRPRQQPSRRQQWPFVLPSRPHAESDASQNLDQKDLFIRAMPDASSARQNEQVTIEYQLFFRDGIQLRHSRLAGSWDAEGFWREEFNVDTRPVPKSVVENGVLYHTIVLKRVAVFPTRPGRLSIDPLEIETEAFFPKGGADPFERFFSLRSRFETVELSSDPVKIDVTPLPPGAPATFEGAVGDFDLRADLSRRNVEVGEPVQVTVTVTGTGNVATLSAPSFDPPGIFERYDPDIETSIRRDGERIRGTKTITHVLVPRSNGEFEMPPVTFAFFQPDEGRYVTLQAELGSVDVTGTAAPLAAGTTSQGLPVDDIASIIPSARSWAAVADTPLYRRAWPYAALLTPAFLLLLLFVHQRRQHRMATDSRYARGRMAHPLARKHLKTAESLLKQGRPRAFYEEIERAVAGFIGNRLNIAELGLTRDQLDVRLDSVGVTPADRRLLRRLLEECDRARFAPVMPDRDAMESARERAAHVIVAVDEAARQHAAARAAA